MTNQSFAGKRSFRAILATLIALVLIVSTFATTALADTVVEYNVTIVDNAESIAITTTDTEPIEILEKAGITLSANDKLDISKFVEGEGGTIVVTRQNEIIIDADDVITTHSVYAGTVGEALKELNITVEDGDVVSHADDEKIKNGMLITIKTPFEVSIKADDKTNDYSVVTGTVSDLIDLAGIEMGKDDYTEPGLGTELKDGMSVEVFRVSYKTEKKTEEIDFKTKKIDDKNLLKGTEKVTKQGKKGSAEVTYKIKYVNGEKVDKTETDRKVVTEPVNKEIHIGTKKPAPKPANNTSVKSNGVNSYNGLTVGQTINGSYTHYCACATCNGNSNGVTSSGKRIYNGMSNPYYIACNWLPLGSVITVNGVKYTIVDRGGYLLSQVGRIDIFTPEGHAACYRYGTGSCTIKILRFGW